MSSPLPRKSRLADRVATARGITRRVRRLSLCELEGLESRTLLTLSATLDLAGTTSTFQDLAGPLGGILQIPSPTTPITTDLTNNQSEVGNTDFADAFDFDSTVPGTQTLAAASTSTVILSVDGNAADYTFQLGPSSAPLGAAFQFIGGSRLNTLTLDYSAGDPIAGGGSVTFSAASGTNVLKVIDPAGTYTTATYDISTQTFTFGGQAILVPSSNLTIDLTGTKVAALVVQNTPAPPNSGATYDFDARTFEILAGGPTLLLPSSVDVPNVAIDATAASLLDVSILGVATAFPATYNLLSGAGSLDLNGIDTITVPFGATRVDLSRSVVSTLSVLPQPGFVGLLDGYRVAGTGTGTVSGLFDGTASSPFLVYDAAATDALSLQVGTLTGLGPNGTFFVVDLAAGNPLPATTTFDASPAILEASLIVRDGAVGAAAVDYAAQTLTLGTQSIALINVPRIDLSGATVTDLNVKLPDVANLLDLSLAAAIPGAPVQLTNGGATTLLYPAAANPVTLTGGSVSNALTVDLFNGNPLPLDAGAGSGLVLQTTAATNLSSQNGVVVSAALDLGAATLKLDTGLIRNVALPIDLTAIGIVSMALSLSAARSAVTLERVATGANPFRFFEAPNTTLLTFAVGTITASVSGFTGVANALTVDYKNGNPIPASGLAFDGKGNGTLTVTGSAALDSVAYTATAGGAGRLAINSGTAAAPDLRTVTFAGLSPLIVTAPAIGTVSVDIAASLAGTAIVTAGPSAAPGQDLVSFAGNVLESIQFTHPANLVLSASGGTNANTFTYNIPSFTNNVTINGGAAKLVVVVARAAAAANIGTMTINGGAGDASVALDLTNGDPIPAAANSFTFLGGAAANGLSVVNPPAASPPAATNLRLTGALPSGQLSLDFGAGELSALGLNQAINLTAGVTAALDVTFANTANAIGLETLGGSSLISVHDSPLVAFDKAKTTTVKLMGGAVTNALTIDLINGNPIPVGAGDPTGLFVNTAGASPLAVVNGTVALATLDVAAKTIALDGSVIRYSALPAIDLSAATVTALTVKLADVANTLGLVLATPGGSPSLTYTGGAFPITYPKATSPVMLTGGAVNNTLTVDLINGNPLPPDNGPGSGLVLATTGPITVAFRNGTIVSAVVDLAAKTLTLDGNVIRYVNLPAFDLSSINVLGVGLQLSAAASAATLQQVATAPKPLRFLVGGNPVLTFSLATPKATVLGAAGVANALTVDYANGNPIPAGGLAFDGKGNGTLTVTGSAAWTRSPTRRPPGVPAAWRSTAGRPRRSTCTVTFAGLSPDRDRPGDRHGERRHRGLLGGHGHRDGRSVGGARAGPGELRGQRAGIDPVHAPGEPGPVGQRRDERQHLHLQHPELHEQRDDQRRGRQAGRGRRQGCRREHGVPHGDRRHGRCVVLPRHDQRRPDPGVAGRDHLPGRHPGERPVGGQPAGREPARRDQPGARGAVDGKQTLARFRRGQVGCIRTGPGDQPDGRRDGCPERGLRRRDELDRRGGLRRLLADFAQRHAVGFLRQEQDGGEPQGGHGRRCPDDRLRDGQPAADVLHVRRRGRGELAGGAERQRGGGDGDRGCADECGGRHDDRLDERAGGRSVGLDPGGPDAQPGGGRQHGCALPGLRGRPGAAGLRLRGHPALPVGDRRGHAGRRCRHQQPVDRPG
ncbi:MAG: hypothetical protein U0800_12330 [Isosphaeraceae bacterium]